MFIMGWKILQTLLPVIFIICCFTGEIFCQNDLQCVYHGNDGTNDFSPQPEDQSFQPHMDDPDNFPTIEIVDDGNITCSKRNQPSGNQFYYFNIACQEDLRIFLRLPPNNLNDRIEIDVFDGDEDYSLTEEEPPIYLSDTNVLLVKAAVPRGPPARPFTMDTWAVKVVETFDIPDVDQPISTCSIGSTQDVQNGIDVIIWTLSCDTQDSAYDSALVSFRYEFDINSGLSEDGYIKFICRGFNREPVEVLRGSSSTRKISCRRTGNEILIHLISSPEDTDIHVYDVSLQTLVRDQDSTTEPTLGSDVTLIAVLTIIAIVIILSTIIVVVVIFKRRKQLVSSSSGNTSGGLLGANSPHQNEQGKTGPQRETENGSRYAETQAQTARDNQGLEDDYHLYYYPDNPLEGISTGQTNGRVAGSDQYQELLTDRREGDTAQVRSNGRPGGNREQVGEGGASAYQDLRLDDGGMTNPQASKTSARHIDDRYQSLHSKPVEGRHDQAALKVSLPPEENSYQALGETHPGIDCTHQQPSDATAADGTYQTLQHTMPESATEKPSGALGRDVEPSTGNSQSQLAGSTDTDYESPISKIASAYEDPIKDISAPDKADGHLTHNQPSQSSPSALLGAKPAGADADDDYETPTQDTDEQSNDYYTLENPESPSSLDNDNEDYSHLQRSPRPDVPSPSNGNQYGTLNFDGST